MRKNAPNRPCETDPWAPNTYQTGSTTPPKSRTGLIALLLVLVIFLSGVVTVLGITNVKLFRMLSGQGEDSSVPITFSGSRKTSAFSTSPASFHSFVDPLSLSDSLGIQGDSVPKVYQLYYRLPCGLYVQSVDSDSACARQGLQPGDIITHMNGTSITGLEDYQAALNRLSTGDSLTLTVYRNSGVFSITVTIDPAR